jgi:hypothetical protein
MMGVCCMREVRRAAGDAKVWTPSSQPREECHSTFLTRCEEDANVTMKLGKKNIDFWDSSVVILRGLVAKQL